MGLYSKLFYNQRLICCTPKKVSEQFLGWKGLKNKEVPILFRHVQGMEARDEDSPSWYNELEVDAIRDLLGSLLSLGIVGDDIGIICPYRKQVEKVRGMIWKSFEKSEISKEVGSTEAFQVHLLLSSLKLKLTF